MINCISFFFSVIEFVRNKSLEYKPKFEVLVSGNIVKGTFEVQITFSCTPRPQDLIDQLSKICQNTRYKFLFNEKWITSQQLIVSSNYEGECPAIIQQIENEVYEYFKDFDIIRIKIKSLTSNEGVPQYDLEKQFSWNDKTNYFELCYKFSLNKNFKETIEKLRRTCRTMFKNQSELKLPEIIFKHTFIENDELILTIHLFEVGRTNALAKMDEIVKYFTTNNFPPSKVLSEFIVHDTNTTLGDD